MAEQNSLYKNVKKGKEIASTSFPLRINHPFPLKSISFSEKKKKRFQTRIHSRKIDRRAINLQLFPSSCFIPDIQHINLIQIKALTTRVIDCVGFARGEASRWSSRVCKRSGRSRSRSRDSKAGSHARPMGRMLGQASLVGEVAIRLGWHGQARRRMRLRQGQVWNLRGWMGSIL